MSHRIAVLALAAVAALFPVLHALPAGADATGPRPEYVVENLTHFWRDPALTWSLRGTPNGVTTQQAEAAIQAALDTWASWSRLTFTQVDDCTVGTGPGVPCAVDQAEPDLRVRFTADPHDEGNGDFDFSVLGGLAHGIYPGTADAPGLVGDIHIDNANLWTVDGSTTGKDLQSIVTHEAGHALGLRHADAEDLGSTAICPTVASPTRPIMCPVIIGIQHALAPDDIAGIQFLYGKPDHLVDSTIRRSTDRAFSGGDIVNTSAKGQTATFNRARNQTAVFLIRVANDGTSPDVVTLDAPPAPAGFTVRYYAGAIGRTAATGIIPGTYQVPLDPDAFTTLRVEVTVKPGAVRNRSQGIAIRATSAEDATRVDVVRPIVHVT